MHRTVVVGEPCDQPFVEHLVDDVLWPLMERDAVRVVRYDRFSGIDELWVDDMPVPEAAPGQVVVEIRAACIKPG